MANYRDEMTVKLPLQHSPTAGSGPWHGEPMYPYDSITKIALKIWR